MEKKERERGGRGRWREGGGGKEVTANGDAGSYAAAGEEFGTVKAEER